MAQVNGVDFSFDRIDNLAALKCGDYDFVIRYLSQVDGGKVIHWDEAEKYLDYNIGIVLVYEWYAQRPLEGNSAGVEDGTTALQQAEAIGFPDTRPIYFAMDWDASAADQAYIDDYLNGVASVIGASRVGVYGGYDVVNRTKSSGTAQWFWQTYAWSGSNIADGIHLYQYSNNQNVGGAAVDLDYGYGSDYGAWFA